MNPGLQEFFRSFRICQPRVTSPDCTRGEIQELSRANYIKEIFLDSETAVAIMSGIPAPSASLQLIGNAVDMSRTPPTIDRPPPVLGEQTDEILGALGLDGQAIANLRAKGAV